MTTRRSIIGTAVALALVVAPAAQSVGMHPDDRALSRASSPDLVGSPHPDDRAISRATSPDLVGSSHPDDRALPRAASPIDPAEPPTLVRVSDRGFDWTDFGVGAVGGFGIALSLMGAALLVLRRSVQREARPA
jgi:hypothetical protein